MTPRDEVSRTLLRLCREDPLINMTLLDLGCGSGALTLALARDARGIIGVDSSPAAIEEARGKAKTRGIENARFVLGDAYTMNYSALGSFDMITAHLFMAKEIIEKAGGALSRGSPFAFACLHHDHLEELGVRSRFSFAEDEMEALLKKAGFRIEYLKAEKETLEFKSRPEALEYFEKAKARWGKSGRWGNLLRYLDQGGRTLTKAVLVVKARRV